MFELMFLALVAGGGSLFGYVASRKFVRQRLWAVNAIQGRAAPVIAGGVAGLAAVPFVALLPVVGLGTAILFGFSIGAGVSPGAKDARALPRG